MTEFPICRLKTRPQFDTLPVMKVTQYPLEPRDYKPFAQGLLAVDPQRLYIRLWAFETPPEPESRIICVLRDQQELRIEAGPQALEITLDGKPIEALLAHPFTGEDLQGKYWAWSEFPQQICWGNSLQAGSSGEISINAVTANAPIPAVSIPWQIPWNRWQRKMTGYLWSVISDREA